MTAAWDAVVVGGGPAGAALAAALGQAGRRVLVLERTPGPHQKVCGEFLSHEAIFYLRRLGLDPAPMGAVPIAKVALVRRNAAASVDLPFPAASLSRFCLDEALLNRAREAGAAIRRGCRVRAIDRQDDLWRVAGDNGTVLCRDLFLATGKHDVHGWKRPPGRQADLIGFKQQVRLAAPKTPAAAGRVELHLFPGGYCGVEPVEGGVLNLSLVVRKGRYAALGSWDALWDHMCASSPALARRTHGAVSLTARPLAIGAIPYGFVRRHSDGAWYLGDQAAVIPSFAGNGISMALHSAHLAATCYLSGQSADAFQRHFARDVGRQVQAATFLSRLLVSPPAQAVLAAGARALPGLMRTIARGTRLPLDHPAPLGA
jgi:menaquinone-9 beta-reductase